MDTNNSHINEKFIQEIWKNQNFSKELCTKNGQKITIIDAGTENKELGGPDFRNAKIKIGNFSYTGDIEIDTHYSDWKSHGHCLNKKYNKLILHLTLNSSSEHSFVFTEDGRKVQSLSLAEFLEENITVEIQKAIVTERSSRQSKMTCIDVNQIVVEKDKLDFLYELGMARFQNKCSKVLYRLKELVYEKELKAGEPVVQYDPGDSLNERCFTSEDFTDHELWEQVLYEMIFEALGYSKNKEQMLRLAKTIDLSFVRQYKNKENFSIYLEAAYFTAAGLIPKKFEFDDPDTSEYVRKLRDVWNEMKPGFDKKLMNYSFWHFHKLRPPNFPTLRVAGGTRIVEKILNDNLIGRIISDFRHINDVRNLNAALKTLLITKGEGYWRSHYTCEDKTTGDINYFIGLSRVDELMVNVIFPVFMIYFEIFNKKDVAKKVQRLYMNYSQISENTLVNEMAENLALQNAWKRSVLYQGMIELFRSYCSRDRCLECKIGKIAFS